MPSWNDTRACPVCAFEGDLGPSDHEPWCPAFMRGAVDLEGEQRLPFVAESTRSDAWRQTLPTFDPQPVPAAREEA